MIYISRTRLMVESEQAISEHASCGPLVTARACKQVLNEPMRYLLWHVRHEQRMGTVADARLRERQILALRAFALEQIHAGALVRYLRDYRVVGAARDQTLREFFGVVDPHDAALMAHRDYLLASSSQVAAAELLELVNDKGAAQLLFDYEQAYGQFFSMFCEASRAKQEGEPYLLASLMPEVRVVAANLRRRILAGDSRVRKASVEHHSRTRPLTIQSHSLARVPRTG